MDKKEDVNLENSNVERVFVERRRKKDWVSRSVGIIAVFAWICAFVSMLLIDKAKPETEDFFSRVLHISVRSSWNYALMRIGVGALAIAFVSCIIGFFVNKSRHHRKTDQYNKSIIVLGIITLIMLLVFTIKFI